MRSIIPIRRMWILLFGITACVLISITPCVAADVTLAWDPNQESDLEGYGVYYKRGSAGPPYDFFGYVGTADLSDENSPVFTVTGLQNATYYFSVTAYDTSGNESAYSTAVCAQVGAVVTACADTGTGTTPPSSGSAPASSGSSGGGGGGGGCFIRTLGGF
jgi:uncharacterized membrane protein YgcG